MDDLTLPFSDMSVSQICLGCMPFGSKLDLSGASALMDVFRTHGGNFFDTAHCYSSWLPCGAGASEIVLGDYIKASNCRNEVVVATKGGHPEMPKYRRVAEYLDAGRIAADIDDSLGRLQIDEIDFYWLHRDDPRLSVGEIVETMNAEVKRGRIRAFGGSNWTSERLAEANGYATAHGLQGFSASQPKWSLMEYPHMSRAERLAPGAMVHMDDSDRLWHCQSQLPVVPYNPTGGGFFARGGKGGALENEENQSRYQRALEIAELKGATPNQVAIAWLLGQSFPVIPILGTTAIDHLMDGMEAVTVALTEEDRAYLEKGAPKISL